MADTLETELCDYLMLRHVHVNANPSESDQVPNKVYKSWKRRWFVMNTQISPTYSYVGYCKSESDWLLNNQSITRCFLGDFKLSRMQVKGYDNVLQLGFKFYSLEVAFDSMTKMDQWYNILQKVSERYHVDLVRSPEHPAREMEYIMQCCVDSFRVWSMDAKPKTALCWEWHLKHIRRIHYHRSVGKLEVEAGRSAETGEGHFFFTGYHSLGLFNMMKEMMTSRAKVTDTQPKQRNDYYDSNGSRGATPDGLGWPIVRRTPSGSSIVSASSVLYIHRTDTPRSIERTDTPRSIERIDTPQSIEEVSQSDDDVSLDGTGSHIAREWYPVSQTTNTYPRDGTPQVPLPTPPPPLPPKPAERLSPTAELQPTSPSQQVRRKPKDRYMKVNPVTKDKDSDYVTIQRQLHQERLFQIESEGNSNIRTQVYDGVCDLEQPSVVSFTTFQPFRVSNPPPVPPHANKPPGHYMYPQTR